MLFKKNHRNNRGPNWRRSAGGNKGNVLRMQKQAGTPHTKGMVEIFAKGDQVEEVVVARSIANRENNLGARAAASRDDARVVISAVGGK